MKHMHIMRNVLPKHAFSTLKMTNLATARARACVLSAASTQCHALSVNTRSVHILLLTCTCTVLQSACMKQGRCTYTQGGRLSTFHTLASNANPQHGTAGVPAFVKIDKLTSMQKFGFARGGKGERVWHWHQQSAAPAYPATPRTALDPAGVSIA